MAEVLLNTDEDNADEQSLLKTIRSARMENDSVEYHQRLQVLSKVVLETCDYISQVLDKNVLEEKITLTKKLNEMKRLATIDNADAEANALDARAALHKSAHLQVKVEMEVERRERIQAALDDAEKRCFASNRMLERKEEDLARIKAEFSAKEIQHDNEINKLREEHKTLQSIITDKELKIKESNSIAKDLSSKADEFQELFNGQLEIVNGLQKDLNVACEENKGLVKEMELLNNMFHELEQTHVNEALNNYEQSEVDLSDAKHKDDKGKVVGVQDILKAVNEESRSSIQDSCFKEVTTKNGTRMVLSVSKTFMKLKDLILEKKTLEDQMEKMKTINNQLCMKVNTHEAKLYNITDELNQTWNYVSTIKLQHKKLHTSEQILRAELMEKRQLLIKLREELEYSRQNWLLVKQKTAESEMEWKALREEFKKRKNEVNSSESGFSDIQTEEEIDTPQTPLRDDKDKINLLPPEEPVINTDTAQDSTKDIEKDAAQSDVPLNKTVQSIPLFIPPMNYLSEVPQNMLPPLFYENRKEDVENYDAIYSRLIESTTRSAMLASRLAEVNRTLDKDDDISISTTDFGAEEDEEDVEPRTEEDSDDLVIESPDLVSDITSEAGDYDAVYSVASNPEERETVEDLDQSEYDTASQASSDFDSDISLECPFPEGFQPSARIQELPSAQSAPYNQDSPLVSPGPALWDEENDSDDDSDNEDSDISVVDGTLISVQEVHDTSQSSAIPTPPPPPPFSLLPPPNTIALRSAYSYENDDSDSDEDIDRNDVDGDANEHEMENATAVTRFLIKHLPKQMAKLRNDKAELEEKIQDLEARISQQSQSMLEMERRMEMSKRQAAWSTSHGDETSSSQNRGTSSSIGILEIPLSVDVSVTSALKCQFFNVPKNTRLEILKIRDDGKEEILEASEVVNDSQIVFPGEKDLVLRISTDGRTSDVRYKLIFESKLDGKSENR